MRGDGSEWWEECLYNLLCWAATRLHTPTWIGTNVGWYFVQANGSLTIVVCHLAPSHLTIRRFKTLVKEQAGGYVGFD